MYGVDDAAFYGVGEVDDAGEKPRGGFDGTREERKGATMAYENIKTYADLARTAGDMVLANEMAKRPLELVSGDCAPWDEVFQWYNLKPEHAQRVVQSAQVTLAEHRVHAVNLSLIERICDLCHTVALTVTRSCRAVVVCRLPIQTADVVSAHC